MVYLTVFYPQQNTLRQLRALKINNMLNFNNYSTKYGSLYKENVIAILSKTNFSNIGEKFITNIMDLHVVFLYFLYFY